MRTFLLTTATLITGVILAFAAFLFQVLIGPH